MIDSEKFKRDFESSKPALRAWGDFVSQKVQEKIKEVKGNLAPEFLKVSCSPRVKALASALKKLEKKQYANPFLEMTDLVGVRFVVLTTHDLKELESIVQCDDWDFVVSKDYSFEIEDSPKVFDYQSKHYEVRPKEDFEFCGIVVRKHICCEIQIRTLLQHAYAELVHDNIYKAEGVVPPSAVRYVSRSMALMETTDELFCSTLEELKKGNRQVEYILKDLERVYSLYVGEESMEADRSLHFNVLECFEKYLDRYSEEQVDSLLSTKKFISFKVSERAEKNEFFRQPIVIFLYWFIHNMGVDAFVESWEFGVFNREASFIASDLGVSLDLRGK